MPAISLKDVKALTFDVFGTCVDWRSSVTRELHEACQHALTNRTSLPSSLPEKAKSMTVSDWERIADEWRTTYYNFTKEQLARPEGPSNKSVDEHHYEALGKILSARGLEGLFSDAEVSHLACAWHRLDSWPDTNAALLSLAQAGFQTATLSNGNLKLLEDMQVHSGMKFTHIFSAETFGTFKPDPRMYLGAAEKMGLQPGQVAMVASHLRDLKAAKGCGLQTIFTERLLEDEDDQVIAKREGYVDLWIALDDGGFEGIVRELVKQ